MFTVAGLRVWMSLSPYSPLSGNQINYCLWEPGTLRRASKDVLDFIGDMFPPL